jgi:PTH2 family peptidyl-tRNA hydrolase
MLDERKRTMAEFTPDHRPLCIVAIYRADLEMDDEKLSAQTGHAYVDALDEGRLLRPELAAQYKGTGHGTKVCMYARNERQLERAYFDALAAGLPAVVVIDRSHILPPHFDGNPVVTAVGIGPVYKDEVRSITKRYSMRRKPLDHADEPGTSKAEPETESISH